MGTVLDFLTKPLKREYDFPSVDRVIRDFEERKRIRIGKTDVKTRAGRMQRDELLILLKDQAGLPYSEIIKYAPFKSLKYSSLGHLYQRMKGKAGRS
jgi:GGDEF domain-containing protein